MPRSSRGTGLFQQTNQETGAMRVGLDAGYKYRVMSDSLHTSCVTNRRVSGSTSTSHDQPNGSPVGQQPAAIITAFRAGQY